jgi:hypothetical protein
LRAPRSAAALRANAFAPHRVRGAPTHPSTCPSLRTQRLWRPCASVLPRRHDVLRPCRAGCKMTSQRRSTRAVGVELANTVAADSCDAVERGPIYARHKSNYSKRMTPLRAVRSRTKYQVAVACSNGCAPRALGSSHRWQAETDTREFLSCCPASSLKVKLVEAPIEGDSCRRLRRIGCGERRNRVCKIPSASVQHALAGAQRSLAGGAA